MPKRVLIPFRHSKKLKPYLDAVRAGGMEPMAADVAFPVALGEAAGLLLMGGTDVSPARYHAIPLPETEAPDDARDQAELDLIEDAMHKDLPILAICRGLQILNVHHGGTLIQHLPSTSRHDPEFENKGTAAHEISIDPASLLRQIAGGDRWQVNSRHHQAADKIGEGLHIVARDPEDGVVEALEQDGSRFVLAVQWHPEDQLVDWPEPLRLFTRFRDAL